MESIANEILVAVGGVFTTFLASWFSYRTGKRQRENEADKAAFEAYNFAIQSLRKEFESRIDLLQRENAELRERVKELESRTK